MPTSKQTTERVRPTRLSTTMRTFTEPEVYTRPIRQVDQREGDVATDGDVASDGNGYGVLNNDNINNLYFTT